MEKKSFWTSFKTWFAIGAVMFGTGFGANIASGAYAAAYIVPVGGGWAIVWLLIISILVSLFGIMSLSLIRSYKIGNYNQFFTTLWGVHKEGNKIARGAVSVFFDVYQTGSGIIACAASTALFGTLLKQLFGLPYWPACILGTVLFAFLTMYGARFLRSFSSVMSVALAVSCVIILFAVIGDRGQILAQRIGNFQIGLDWGISTVPKTAVMILIFCFSNSSVGALLSNFSEKITTRRDSVGAGIVVGIMSALMLLLTGIIVLPYMPDCHSDAPVLTICSTYLKSWVTVIYWIIAILAIVSTVPTMAFGISNRWVSLWKTEKVAKKMKFFIISIVFLAASLLISSVGLMTIVRVLIQFIGYIAIVAIVIPLIVSVFRVRKHDKAE